MTPNSITPGPDLIPAPRALSHERAVLGAAIVYPSAAADILTGLESGDFYEPRHQSVFTTVRAMLADGIRPEPLLVLDRLWTETGVRPVTGSSWALILADLVTDATLPSSVAPHRRALLHARLRREALDYATHLTHTATTGDLTDLNTELTASLSTLGRTLARLTEHTHPATGAESVALAPRLTAA